MMSIMWLLSSSKVPMLKMCAAAAAAAAAAVAVAAAVML
jgi:hypothetical protein